MPSVTVVGNGLEDSAVVFGVVVVDGLATNDVFGGYFSMGLSTPGFDYSIGVVPTFGVVEEDPSFFTSTSLGNRCIFEVGIFREVVWFDKLTKHWVEYGRM